MDQTATMALLTVAFLGDICGSPGRMVVQQQLPALRAEHAPDLVIANAENARAGSGLSPALYEKIRGYGIDGLTLGDHVYRDVQITTVLESPDAPIARPANLPEKAVGRTYIRLRCPAAGDRSVIVITVLGRIFFNMPADDPFATVDRLLARLPEADPIVIVEAHMEATSEKAALANYLDGRVALVVGSHTHVPTADARILPGGTGFITDLGMCGPYNSIIGRSVDAVVRQMTTSLPTPFSVARGGESMCGVLARIDLSTGRTHEIRRLQYDARQDRPPFSAVQA
ncbi:MAG: TIGR00282 family metallophosphoesterase [Planctomycetota bacterium]|jgi:metallophosphoesterase (TIGR00282 family)